MRKYFFIIPCFIFLVVFSLFVRYSTEDVAASTGYNPNNRIDYTITSPVDGSTSSRFIVARDSYIFIYPIQGTLIGYAAISDSQNVSFSSNDTSYVSSASLTPYNGYFYNSYIGGSYISPAGRTISADSSNIVKFQDGVYYSKESMEVILRQFIDSNFKVIGDPPLNGDNPDIGHLRVLSVNKLTIVDDTSPEHLPDDLVYRVRWFSTTDTNYKLTPDDFVYVRGVKSYESIKSRSTVVDSYDYGSFTATELSIDLSSHDSEFYPNVFEAFRNDGFNTNVVDFKLYFRIYSSSLDGFSDWVEVNVPKFIDNNDVTPSTPGHFDDDGNFIYDGPSTDVPVGDGRGPTPDEADDDVSPLPGIGFPDIPNFDGNFDDIKNGIINSLNSFISALQGFIGLVRTVLSFLPNWVLNFFALSVAIWCIMLIKRAIF